jgi:flagellar basal-body rod protein FlgC
MGMFDGYNISGHAMSAQRTKINTISANIANAHTTMTPDGGPYKRKEVIFGELINQEKQMINNQEKVVNEYSSVKVNDIVNSNKPPIYKYEPNHPHANKDGYVGYPDINEVQEMTDMMVAMRAYQSNVSVFQGQKNIDNATIDILK